jgi:hypothetical protein
MSTHKVTWGMLFNHGEWPLPADIQGMKKSLRAQVPEFEYLDTPLSWTNQLHGWDDMRYWVLEATAEITSEQLAWILLKYPDSPRRVL